MASGRVCESGIGIGIEIVVEIVFVIVIAIDDSLRVSQCCANTYDMYVYITRWHFGICQTYPLRLGGHAD